MNLRRFVILTPFNRPDVVAGVLRLRGLDARVVDTDSGVCVVHEVTKPEFTDWDIAELLGESPEEPVAEGADNPDNLAGPLSALSDYGVVLLTAELGDVGSESGLSGMVNGVRYLRGARDEEIQAGILLNMADPKVEDLVINGAGTQGISTMDLTVQDVEKILGKPGEVSE